MKKAPIAIALVLVFGLFAAAFSLGPAIAQNATSNTTTGNATSTNATSTGNATTMNATTTGGSTFSAKGSIATLIFDTGAAATTSSSNATSTASMGNETSTTGNMTSSGNTTSSASGNVTMSQTITGNASSNMTSSGNATSSANATNTSNATSTSGNATSTSAEMEAPYILSGDWNLDVQNGSVSDFKATFTMVHIDGTGRHTHELSNFQASNTTTVQLEKGGSTFIFGTADVAVNGTVKWTNVGTLIILEKNVATISLATDSTDNHFKGQPIYGIIDSMTDENGNEMIQTTQTAGNATAGNVTQGAQNAANKTGQFLGNVTEGVKDFFNGTG